MRIRVLCENRGIRRSHGLPSRVTFSVDVVTSRSLERTLVRHHRHERVDVMTVPRVSKCLEQSFQILIVGHSTRWLLLFRARMLTRGRREVCQSETERPPGQKATNRSSAFWPELDQLAMEDKMGNRGTAALHRGFMTTGAAILWLAVFIGSAGVAYASRTW